MVGWLATSPRTGLVLDDMQVVSVKVAVALCADAAVAPGDLGPMAEHRVPLGPGMNALSGRLRLLGMPSACRRSAAPGAGLRLAACDGERVDGAAASGYRESGYRDRPGASRRDVSRRMGRVVVRLSPEERGLLRAACERLLGLLDGRVLDLTDERTHAVRLGIEEVLADLRQPQPAPAPSFGGLDPPPLRPARTGEAGDPAATPAPGPYGRHARPGRSRRFRRCRRPRRA